MWEFLQSGRVVGYDRGRPVTANEIEYLGWPCEEEEEEEEREEEEKEEERVYLDRPTIGRYCEHPDYPDDPSLYGL